MRFNRLFFWLFYRLGTPPWEGHPLPERLLELIEILPLFHRAKRSTRDAGQAIRQSISHNTVGT